jgi:hypothetical protein
MKQTAVEWLVDWMGKNQYFIGNDLLQAVEQAKAMEKEQIINAHLASEDDENESQLYRDFLLNVAEQYYNETYNK